MGAKILLVLRLSVCEARSCGRERAFVDVEEMVVDDEETCHDTATCLAYMTLDLPRRAHSASQSIMCVGDSLQ